MSELDRLLDALPPRVLVGGKGGVGKTTCAAALALRSADRGSRTLLLSTDPAGSLGDALQAPLGGVPEPVPGRPALYAAQLDPAAARDAFLTKWRDVLVAILDRGTYLDRDDVVGLVDASLPGLDETMAVLTLIDLDRDGWERIVLDTAPTGHALRLLELPAAFSALIALLDAMQEKHRFMVSALTHRYRVDEADRFLASMRQRVEAFRRSLADPSRFAVVLVARAEMLVVEETARYIAALHRLGLSPRAVVVNAVPADGATDETRAALAALAGLAPGAAYFQVPLLERPPVAMDGIARWGDAFTVGARRSVPISPGARTTGTRQRAPTVTPSRHLTPSVPFAAPPLTIVGGKGGVGKTSVACALAVSIATAAHPVLVVSTDPAPSVADALLQPVGEEIVPVDGAPGLFAQQLDASAAFARFRARYSARVDAVFDSLVRGSMDATFDRRIARELLALAPPGIDEVYALASLGETLADGRYATVIVDPAPTGHLLRLLALPALALDWTHRLLRLTLEYKELVRLGEATEELLGFARRTRALAALLRDPARAGVLVVALDEPLVREESARLIERVRALDITVLGVLWNRARDTPHPLPVTHDIAQFASSELVPPPRGVDALRAWAHDWNSLTLGVNG